VSLEKVTLQVKKVRVQESIYQSLASGMKKQLVHYPIQKTAMHPLVIPKGQKTVNAYIFKGLSPKVIITAFVKRESMSSHTLDPFKFEDFKLKSFTIHRQSGRTEVFQPNEWKLPEFTALCRTFGHKIGISLDDFKSNTFILVTNLAADMNINEVQKFKIMQLRLEATFEQPMEHDVTVINLAICDEDVTIDKNFRVNL
jgi:hypothetical protein